MSVGAIDERGRVVIPQELRERLGMSPGSPVRVDAAEGGVLIRPARDKRDLVQQLRGVIPKDHAGPAEDPRRAKGIWKA